MTNGNFRELQKALDSLSNWVGGIITRTQGVNPEQYDDGTVKMFDGLKTRFIQVGKFAQELGLGIEIRDTDESAPKGLSRSVHDLPSSRANVGGVTQAAINERVRNAGGMVPTAQK